MNDLQKELLETTQRYTNLKRQLEKTQREYEFFYAGIYLQERILGMKTEEMRKNEMIRIMETENHDLLEALQELRGATREQYYKMEALTVVLSGHKNIKE